MLYVVDAYNINVLAVYDTDDGVKDIINLEYMIQVNKRGVVVEGFSVSRGVIEVVEYNNQLLKSGLRWVVKDNFILRFNHYVLRSCTVGNDFQGTRILYLSDVCEVCENGCFAALGMSFFSGSAVIVFDDSIELRPGALKHIFRASRVTCDIRKITDINKARLFYEEYLSSRSDKSILPSVIIDDEVRKVKCMTLLSRRK